MSKKLDYYARAFSSSAETVRQILDKISDAASDPSLRLSLEDSLREGRVITSKLVTRWLRFLRELEYAFKFILVDAVFRKRYMFHASLDLSEIYAYVNPLPDAGWSKMVRFAIENHEVAKRKYNILPTTMLEILAYLRKIASTCDAIPDLDTLKTFLSATQDISSKEEQEDDELEPDDISDIHSQLSTRRFTELILAADSNHPAKPHDPASGLLELVKREIIESLDDHLTKILSGGGETLNKYNTEYNRVLGTLESKRDKPFSNSIDARSYQLSLALNDILGAGDSGSYLPIMSSGRPLDAFLKVGWGQDPVAKSQREALFKRNLIGRHESWAFTTARGPYYHYLWAALSLKHNANSSLIETEAENCLTEVRNAREIWANAIKDLFERKSKIWVGSSLRDALLGKVEKSAELKEISYLLRDVRIRIPNPHAYRSRKQQDEALLDKIGNDKKYKEMLTRQHEQIRDLLLRLHQLLPNSTNLLLEADKRGFDGVPPEFLMIAQWISEYGKST